MQFLPYIDNLFIDGARQSEKPGSEYETSFIYPLSELEKRRADAQQLMHKEKLDALLITNDENFLYLIGLPGPYGQHRSNDRPGVAIIPSTGAAVCIVSGATSPNIKPVVKKQNIHEYTSTLGIDTELIVQALREVGLKNKRIGIEGGLSQRLGMPFNDYARVLKAFPEISFVDAASLLWKMRMVKSDTEIRFLKQSADIVDRARQKCFDELSVGMTYREINRLFSKLMLEEGADAPAFTIVGSWPQDNTAAVGKDFVIYRILQPDIATRAGEALFLDGGAYVHVYTVDYNRWAVFGKAAAKMRKYHEIARNVSMKMGEAMRPGMTCSDVFKVAQKELKAAGAYSDQIFAGRMGHGQGMLWTEPPSVAPADKTVLEPGLVISTEPFATGESMWVAWEDTWVVREDGAELLTKESGELREISR